MADITRDENIKNGNLLYDIICDFVDANGMTIGELISVLEQIKLEYTINEMLLRRDEDEE